MADVLILSGPPGAGKSSVAQALAQRYDRVAHIDVDALRHLITPTGYVAPGKVGFGRQQELAIRNACSLTRNFLAERIAVIIDDVVVAASDLEAYIGGLKEGRAPIHFVCLLPDIETCKRRNQERATGRVAPDKVERVHAAFAAPGRARGETIDSSDLSVDQTADGLQALTSLGKSLVWSPD